MNELTPSLISQHRIEPGWRFGLTARARWSDLDGFSHVSHRAHFVWFEEARNAYLAELGFALVSAYVPGPVVKEVVCSYERGLAFDDAVAITARTEWFGRTSFGMDYAIWCQGLVARGSAVCVWFHNRSASKVVLPLSLCEGMKRDGATCRASIVPVSRV
ncbi:acyl-CoA thioesterase (plasmid) [Comamonadaceae bacterium OTU4NAUVB1]|nr:acyl-CoA thioesterase [Comamonadaceae bacterium OTU4NAUVB1]